MSMPLLLNLIDELERDPMHFGHDFGLGLQPHHIHHGQHRHHPANMVGYSSPMALLNLNRDRQLSRSGTKEGEGKLSAVGKAGFQVCMDVAHFKPSELNVKVVDNCVIVEGKHEEREDNHGHITRHFVRRYVLPEGYDSDKVLSTLSSDGVLTVSIPKPQLEDKSAERVIPIQQVGPAHLNVKYNTQEEVGDANGAGDNAKK